MFSIHGFGMRMNFYSLISICCLLIWSVSIPISRADAQSDHPASSSVARALLKAEEATFGLLVDGHLNGSGVIVSADGLVLTAAHQVIDIDRPIETRSDSLGRHPLRLVALDVASDIALMKLPESVLPYPYVRLAESPPKLVDEVYLIGSPIYRHNIFHSGRVAVADVRFEYLPSREHYVDIIHVTGSSPPGTSGGPWLNRKGELVGTQVGLMHDKKRPTQIAYMSSLKRVRALLGSAQTVTTASLFLGVEEFWEQGDEYRAHYSAGQEGLVVTKVRAGSAVAKSAIKPYDLIISIDGESVSYRKDLLLKIRAKKPGDQVVLGILTKNGEKTRVPLILSAL